MNKTAMTAVLLAALGLLAVPVFAQDSGATTPTNGQAGANSVDQTFVNKAIQSNDQEIDQARAQLRATRDAAIQLFANTMIRDHTLANSQLAAVARGLNLQFPSSHIAQGQNGTPPPAAYGSGGATAMSPSTALR